MKNISLELSEKLDPGFVEVILEVHKAASVLEIPFFLIGATARDIILLHMHNIEPMRATLDIDCAVQVESWDRFEQMKNELTKTGHFKVQREIHRLMHKSGISVDIVPFGGLSSQDSIGWPPDFAVKMSVEGFNESYRNTVSVLLQEDPEIIIKVASLEGLALLKLISWDEAPYERNKDGVDIFYIMTNYLQAGNLERLYDDAGDLFDGENTADYDEVAATFLGRNIGEMLDGSESIKIKAASILSRETTSEKMKGLIQTIVTSSLFPQYSYQQVASLFKVFHKGICDKIENRP